MNLTCNTTLEDLRILPTSETKIAGPLTFHDLALIIGGSSTIVAIIMSLYLIFMHAIHYTKPNEQRHIIRILFMVPIYATASFLSIKFYWHAIYFQVISDCYEAFAISSFFGLLCSYIRPELHDQKNYFRDLRVIIPWVWPISWFKKCCGGDRGPWRTPLSGLTWFNIIWIGIYHYCFIRVAMTITAVVTQYFGRYCESSNSPVFSHIWVLVIESVAVTIAMYCVIQFYVQLRNPLAEHRPFLKVLAIKLVIFLSFWQSTAISVGTSTLHLVSANDVIAYPDIKVGIPSLLLCFEMACFAFLHLWAFPYRPYMDNARTTFYPVADPDGPDNTPKANEHFPKSGGFLGLRAIWHALNIWDVAKAFGRGVRWLFVGVRNRREDISYQVPLKTAEMDLDDLSPHNFNSRKDPSSANAGTNNGGAMFGDDVDTSYRSNMLNSHLAGMRSTDHLPIASQFRRSRFDTLTPSGSGDENVTENVNVGGPRAPKSASLGVNSRRQASDEAAGLIAYAQPMSSSAGGGSQRQQSGDSSPERYDPPQRGPTVAAASSLDNTAYYGDDDAHTYGAGGRGYDGGRPQQLPQQQQTQQKQQPYPEEYSEQHYPEHQYPEQPYQPYQAHEYEPQPQQLQQQPQPYQRPEYQQQQLQQPQPQRPQQSQSRQQQQQQQWGDAM